METRTENEAGSQSQSHSGPSFASGPSLASGPFFASGPSFASGPFFASGPSFANVFGLCTGRGGATTFLHAAAHATHFTARHESRPHDTGPARLACPSGPVRTDNRLRWFPGRPDAGWGDRPLPVHLTRNPRAIAAAFAARADRGIRMACRTERLMRAADRNKTAAPPDVCRDEAATVTANIALFLRDHPPVEHVALETAKADFPRVRARIGATGDLGRARAEWQIRHNAPPAG